MRKTCPSMIKRAAKVAAALQYQAVLSFSLYRSINVRLGCHFGSGGDISVSFAGVLLRTLRQVSILEIILFPCDPCDVETRRNNKGRVSCRRKSQHAPLLRSQGQSAGLRYTGRS